MEVEHSDRAKKGYLQTSHFNTGCCNGISLILTPGVKMENRFDKNEIE